MPGVLGGVYTRGYAAKRRLASAIVNNPGQSSNFASKHTRLTGVRAPIFGIARFVVEFRAFLLFAAGLIAIVSTGGNPVEIVRRAMGGGGAQQNTWEGDFDDDEEDLFADDD